MNNRGVESEQPATFRYLRIAGAVVLEGNPDGQKKFDSVLAGSAKIEKVGPALVAAIGASQSRALAWMVGVVSQADIEERIAEKVARSANKWSKHVLERIDEHGWITDEVLKKRRKDKEEEKRKQDEESEAFYKWMGRQYEEKMERQEVLRRNKR